MDWHTKGVRIFFSLVVVGFFILQINHAFASVSSRLSGRILLQVESRGEAWYVYPVDQKRYSLGRPVDAFQIMRSLGLGINNVNLSKIPEAESTGQGDRTLRRRLSGRILLQVESRGEAWYVNPVDLKRYFLGRPADALRIIRTLGLGITNTNLQLISQGQLQGGTASPLLFSRIIRLERSSSIATCDTDGGVNMYDSGTVTTTKQGITTTLTDTCVDEKLLYEQYCASANMGGGTVTINCLGSCESGACTRVFDVAKCKRFAQQSSRAEEDTINFVIVGAGYSHLEEFIPWVKAEFTPSFFSVEPWKSNQDAFNFYYVDEVAPFDQGTFSWTEALPLAEHCQKPNKVIVFMHNSAFRDRGSLPSIDQTLANLVGNSSISAPYYLAYTDSKGNFNPARLAISPGILIHEVGHALGGLRDEYVEEGGGVGSELLGRFLGPNCFSSGVPTTREQCLVEAPWKDLISLFPESVGCFEGCNYRDRNIYRPTEVGIMRDYSSQAFGLAEERSICCEILGRTGSVGGYCNLFNQEPLHLVEYCKQEVN